MVFPRSSAANSSQLHRLEIPKSRVNRLLRKHPPLHFPKLTHILLPEPRLVPTRPLSLQDLRPDPWALRRRHADPLPIVSSVRPFLPEEPALPARRAHQPQISTAHRQRRTHGTKQLIGNPRGFIEQQQRDIRKPARRRIVPW